MPSIHKRNPIPFRPAEGDRSLLLAYAAEHGRPVNAVLRDALREYLERHARSEGEHGDPPETA